MLENLYHITYLKNIDGIAKNGLKPGAGQTFRGFYQSYSAGWLFLTEADGVSYWFGKLEEHAEANTDTPEEGWIPVALFVGSTNDFDLEEDKIGSEDSNANAWKTKETISPDSIEIWDGGDWVPIEEADTEMMLEEVLDASEEEFDEDDPEESWWIIEYDYFEPDEEEL